VQFYSARAWHDATVTGNLSTAVALAQECKRPARVIDRNADDKTIYENKRAARMTK
jgi:hypothetical protein